MKLVKLATRVVVYAAHHFRDGPKESAARASALPPGHATVVGTSTGRVGVFCDAAGELHAVTAVCTHLDWELEFNPGSQSWDCPRHGAKFAIDGAVIDGPATTPLNTVCLPDQVRARLSPPSFT